MRPCHLASLLIAAVSVQACNSARQGAPGQTAVETEPGPSPQPAPSADSGEASPSAPEVLSLAVPLGLPHLAAADAGSPPRPAAPGPYAYCDPSAAIAAYPRFGAQVPQVVANLYPGGGRDYPVIDAHTHLSAASASEKAVLQQAGIYAAVVASWDSGSTAQLRAGWPVPFLIQFNLGDYLQGLSAGQVPSILTALDGQRAAGAGGVKLFKDLGLTYNDSTGARLRVDDERLDPLWEKAADEKWTVSMHIADPDSWMAAYFAGSPYSKQDLVQQFIRVVERHPRTVFVAIHLLNLVDSDAELDQLGGYLDRYPNLYADTAARSQYLADRDQAHVRAFMLAHQDKLLFATDRVGEAVSSYEQEMRYWETTGPSSTFYLNKSTTGLGLPPAVLEKLYYQNSLRAFCGHMPGA